MEAKFSLPGTNLVCDDSRLFPKYSLQVKCSAPEKTPAIDVPLVTLIVIRILNQVRLALLRILCNCGEIRICKTAVLTAVAAEAEAVPVAAALVAAEEEDMVAALVVVVGVRYRSCRHCKTN
jgi:hypothetical protein